MKKNNLKFVIVGHVDHGKSTLIGRLLFDTNSISEAKINDIKQICEALGKPFEFAFIMDHLEEERQKSITIDTTQTFFKTAKRDYVIIDAPGHVQFLKNMITGASSAQAAVLIIDAQEGIREQTRRHLCLVDLVGIKKVIIVINKIDLVNYQEKNFNKTKDEINKFLKNLNLQTEQIIPLSAKENINITDNSPKLSWYRGPHLLKGFDLLKIENQPRIKALRLPIQDIYTINGKKIPVGKIISGQIKKGQKIKIAPSGQETSIKSIMLFNKEIKSANQGENVGLILNNQLAIQRGDIIIDSKDHLEPTNPIEANILWLAKKPLLLNQLVNLRCSTQEAMGRIEKIKKRINSSTLETIEQNAKELKTNELGQITVKTEKPIIVEKFSDLEELGRLIVEENNMPAGTGILP